MQNREAEGQTVGPQVQDSAGEQAGKGRKRQESIQEYDAEDAAHGAAGGCEAVRGKKDRDWQEQGESEARKRGRTDVTEGRGLAQIEEIS